MTKRHFSYSEIVNSYSTSGWGRKFDSIRDAEKWITENSDLIVANSISEILARVNSICEAIGNSLPKRKKHRSQFEVCDDSGKFPSKQVGQFLYSFDSDEGINRWVIVGRDDEGHCIICECDFFDMDRDPYICIAGGYLSETIEAAVARSAQEDLNFHIPRMLFAKRSLEAVKAGENLCEFLDGMEEQQNEEDEDN